MPACPYERARVRVAARRREQTNMQQVLPRAGAPGPGGTEEGFEALVKGLEAFGGELVANEPGTAAPSGSFSAARSRRASWTTRCSRGRTAFRCSSTTAGRISRFPEHTESTQVPRLARRDARARLCEKDVPALGRLPRAHTGATRTARRDPRWPTPCATGGTRTSTTTRKMTHATDSNKYKVVCVLTRIDPRDERAFVEKKKRYMYGATVRLAALAAADAPPACGSGAKILPKLPGSGDTNTS